MSLVLSKNIEGLNLLNKNEIEIIRGDESSAEHKIVIVNLMPNKVQTEYELLNLIGRSSNHVGVYFLKLKSHKYKNISEDYLRKNYYTIDDIKNKKIDGFIVTGAPVETIKFEEVKYWDEIKMIFDFIDLNAKSALFICWGAQAALNHYYKIRKVTQDTKIFGVFKHSVIKRECALMKNVENGFLSPHSRYTKLNKRDIENCNDICIVSESKEVGEHILEDCKKRFYILGHCEYDKNDLKNEYIRDVNKLLKTDIPKNYFDNDNPENDVIFSWNEEAKKIYLNWIEYLR